VLYNGRVKRALLVLMVGVVVTASLAAHQQPEPATKPWTVAVIQKRLTQSGLQTRVDVKVEQPYLSVPGQVLVTPDGTEIQAYIYSTTSAREADTRKLDPKKAAPPTVQPHWLMPVSLVSNANTALIVLSRDPAMHGRIASLFGSSPSAQTEIEDIVRRFHQALQERDVKSIEVLVDENLVVFENGERNDGWADFRDNHLVPELQEPAPQSTWELIKVKASAEQGWAYTRETMSSARGTRMVLWSVFVLEKRGAEWKIVLLDWSRGRAK